ncbi:uncharacterized protein LOC131084158 isoform X2 [Melospiza georgiana]|uniref:uncharacterized protein LOC131084158 isoform X2 n=1 Tax=Melospiza georgiana TaxID=44398 RepID=UPI0025ACD6D6|nr:uncharacterized protein LOC131084158 isoform X2 [Melospiza georgiana]
MAARGGAPLPGLSPVRGQSAGTAASARVTLSLPGPASPGARPAAQNAASEPGAGPMPSARQRRREAAGGALRAGKITKLLPSLPKALVFGQPKARGLSTRALLEGSGPAHAVGLSLLEHPGPCHPLGHRGSPVPSGFGTLAGMWQQPQSSWSTSREGTRGSLWDEAGESEQRSSLRLEKGKGTNMVSPGHL